MSSVKYTYMYIYTYISVLRVQKFALFSVLFLAKQYIMCIYIPANGARKLKDIVAHVYIYTIRTVLAAFEKEMLRYIQ